MSHSHSHPSCEHHHLAAAHHVAAAYHHLQAIAQHDGHNPEKAKTHADAAHKEGGDAQCCSTAAAESSSQ